uniref:Uncharacterized protein n=1 Tax=Meleagris gallopavo TaxID=9103 RepID=A0A803XXF2_MELGA
LSLKLTKPPDNADCLSCSYFLRKLLKEQKIVHDTISDVKSQRYTDKEKKISIQFTNYFFEIYHLIGTKVLVLAGNISVSDYISFSLLSQIPQPIATKEQNCECSEISAQSLSAETEEPRLSSDNTEYELVHYQYFRSIICQQKTFKSILVNYLRNVKHFLKR